VPAHDAPEKVIVAIGRRIAELRNEHGLTQRELAKKLKVSIPWVSRVEAVGENLTIETMVRIAHAIGVLPKELWEAPGPRTPKVQRGRPTRVRRAIAP
jgi:transcriptional regulator with XRE-family HTH domain